MMRIIITSGVISVLAAPIGAQFGLPKNNKAGTSFEELNEKMRESGGMEDADTLDLSTIQEMFSNSMTDPETMKAFEQMGLSMLEGMNKLGDMDPQFLEKQFEEMTKMMTGGDIMNSVMEKKDEVLENLEKTGLVTAEELAKYKADPAYFEDQMSSAFDKMKDMFSNPSLLSDASDAMKGVQDMMSNPVIQEINDLLLADSVTDIEIEEMRLKFLQHKESLSNGAAAAMMGSMMDDVNDSAKFKNAIVESREMLSNIATLGDDALNIGNGAGVGEL
mmetsp:Transcript_3219/g.3780  ORF Transcript_3219/g.3780 Transcript_3219/m.3780 type:complete len:276 (+) Transcript_3219:79-906(+)|eukprot:CAMPEP_0194145392 /NCGR_PEP_ID=MMETSP0152-20130528/17333_1 /TAXON_ID=1049557 /ORGANISM="Thalassiothrix antarctica, Strain L6-D1" /LENGTH=275 /DNA_ID=CAMNT_0038845621 /DNA_START=37 /DNA_END=864 /DNA_ORIENTATION=+